MTSTASTQGRIARRQLGAEVGIGLVLGFMLVAFMLSFASLLFAGAGEFVGVGAGLLLLGAAVHNLVSAARSSVVGAIIVPQDASTAIVAAGVASLLPAVDLVQRPGTIFVYTAVCTVAAGVLMLGLGLFRLGGLVRFIPIPVIGGFLAGTGWLLVAGGSELVTAGYAFDPAHVIALSAAAVFGVGLLVILRLRPSVVVVPLMVGAGVVAFFTVLAVTGISLDEARALDLLPVTVDGSFRFPIREVADADWRALADGIGGIISLPLVATMALLLNVSALDLIRRDDSDLDNELRSVGLANLVTAFGGSPAGYHALGPTALGYRLGIASRTVPLVVAGISLLAAFAGSLLVGLVPVPVVGGLLLFLGLGFMTDWLIDRRRQMAAAEYVVMISIVVVVATLGLLAAVAWGMLAAVVLFVVAYSRVDPIRFIGTGRDRRSTVDRPTPAAAFLDEAGHRLLVVELQGYLFFGTSHALVDRVQAVGAESGRLQVLVIDLHRVQGADSTALTSFAKLARLTHELGCGLILSDVPSRLQPALDAAMAGQAWMVSEDIDHALEAAEGRLLEGLERPEATGGDVFGPELWRRVKPHLERVEVGEGEVIIEHGGDEVALIAVDQGEIVTEIPAEGGWRRVRRSGPGTVVGEMSLYRHGGRSARVRTVEATVFYRLDGEVVSELERTQPETAAELHRALAKLMAERLAHGNEVIRSLLG